LHTLSYGGLKNFNQLVFFWDCPYNVCTNGGFYMTSAIKSGLEFCQWAWGPLEKITKDADYSANLNAAINRTVQLSTRLITVCAAGAVVALALMVLGTTGTVGAAASLVLRASLTSGLTAAAFSFALLHANTEANNIEKARNI
jgi:hypothetical protein